MKKLLVLAVNAGFDAQDSIVKLLEESSALGEPVGLDINSGEALKPSDAGIFDNYIVKKQIITSWLVSDLFVRQVNNFQKRIII